MPRVSSTTPVLQVLRPSTGRWRRSITWPGLVGTVALGAAFRNVDGPRDLVLLVALVVGTVVVVVGGTLVAIRTTAVVIGKDQVAYRRWWARDTALDRDDLLVGLLAPYVQHLAPRSVELLLLRAADGGPRIRLSGAFWSHDDLAAIARAAGVPVEATPLDAAEFEERAPGTTYWRDRHPWLFGAGLALLIIVAATIGAIAWLYW